MQKEYRWDPQQEQVIKSIFGTKVSHVLKNKLDNIKRVETIGSWIPTSGPSIFDQYWSYASFKNKRSIAKANRLLIVEPQHTAMAPYRLQLTMRNW